MTTVSASNITSDGSGTWTYTPPKDSNTISKIKVGDKNYNIVDAVSCSKYLSLDGLDHYDEKIKEWVKKEIAAAVQGNPDLDRRKYKVVMGEL